MTADEHDGLLMDAGAFDVSDPTTGVVAGTLLPKTRSEGRKSDGCTSSPLRAVRRSVIDGMGDFDTSSDRGER